MFATALLLLQATFESPRVVESSGVAVSRAYPDVLWTHNDSGDGPYLYATDLHGKDRGAVQVSGAQAIDWEDISLGPCPFVFRAQPRASCIYVADTGDNLELRTFVTVYVVPEPHPPERASDSLGVTNAAAVLNLRYPDGSHDVEAVYVSPRHRAVFHQQRDASRRCDPPVPRRSQSLATAGRHGDKYCRSDAGADTRYPAQSGRRPVGDGSIRAARRTSRRGADVFGDLPVLSRSRRAIAASPRAAVLHRGTRDRRRSHRLPERLDVRVDE